MSQWGWICDCGAYQTLRDIYRGIQNHKNGPKKDSQKVAIENSVKKVLEHAKKEYTGDNARKLRPSPSLSIFISQSYHLVWPQQDTRRAWSEWGRATEWHGSHLGRGPLLNQFALELETNRIPILTRNIIMWDNTIFIYISSHKFCIKKFTVVTDKLCLYLKKY